MRNKKIFLIGLGLLFFSQILFARTFSYSDKTVEIEKDSSGNWDYNNVKINYKSGDLFKGKVDSQLNLIEGEFFYNSTKAAYTGTFNKNGQPHGLGKRSLPDGTIYDGNWIDGKFRGYGKKINSDGSLIEGNFVSDSVVAGKDSYIQWSNGASYKGETDETGVFNGNGTYTFENGDTYEGGFVDNKRTGFGKSTYNGSSYTGSYYGDVRNGNGDFVFYNGYEYKGHFFEGTFNGTGYLLVDEDEKCIYASDDWDGGAIPENGNAKIIFEDGLVWEGVVKDYSPVVGSGIWTTQEERLAKLKEKNNYSQLASYSINGNNIIVASVYTPEEVQKIIHSANYVRDFDNFYKSHKSTFDKVIKGLQVVAGVLSIVPSPVQPLVIAVSIGLATVDISLKTMDASFDLYDAIKAGNQSFIKNILVDYGKDIAFDVIDIICMGSSAVVSLKGLESGLKLAKLPDAVIRIITDSSLKIGAIIAATTSALVAKNTRMGEIEKQLRSLQPVKNLSDKDLIRQGNRLRATSI